MRTESRVYAEIEKVRREQAQQSAELIANQASLKALMSTNDRLTVEDGSQSILPTSHADLLILENPAGEMLALHSKSGDVTSSVVKPLMQRSASDEDWWFIGGHLYDVNLVPIVAGAGAEERSWAAWRLGARSAGNRS